MKPVRRPPWTEARETLALRLWDAGLSSRFIARKLNCFTHCLDGGRNAVIGQSASAEGGAGQSREEKGEGGLMQTARLMFDGIVLALVVGVVFLAVASAGVWAVDQITAAVG